MLKHNTEERLIWILRLGAFLCFAGWTWVHFYWEGPLGILVWDDSVFQLAERFGVNWEEFVGSGANDGLVQKWLGRVWWLFFACSILTLTVRPKAWLQITALIGGSGLLTLLSFAKYTAAQGQLPMFVEHGGQMLMPIILVLALNLGIRHRATVITAMVAFVATFAGHGAYALGLWPTPATFYGMTIKCLSLDYQGATLFLRAAGVLDFVVCLGIFVPLLRRSSALYAVAWGFLTALARPVAGMASNLNYWGADQYIHEAVLRAPHFLIPLYLYFLWQPVVHHKQASNDLKLLPDNALNQK